MVIWFGRAKEGLTEEVMFELSLIDERGQPCAELGESRAPQQKKHQCKGSTVGKEASSRITEKAKWLTMSEQGGEYRR